MSKASLKQQCLLISEGDIDKATKLYEFYIKDMEDLPTFDPIQPTTMQQVKETASNTFQWVKDNKDDIFEWVGFFRSMFSKGGGASEVTPLPPINK